MNKKTILIIVFSVIASFTLGYLVGNKTTKTPTVSTTLTPTPTPTATPVFTLLPTEVPTDTAEVTPTVTVTATASPTSTSTTIKFLKVTSEDFSLKAGPVAYSYSFTDCSAEHCNHYLLPTSKVSQFPILSTVESPVPFPFMITTNVKDLESATGSSYKEMTTAIEIYLGTVFQGIRNDFGDGKSYYSFQACLGGEWSTCRVYLLDTAKASPLLKSLLVDSRKNKTAYIASKTTDGGAAAGTRYYYMTSGISVYFK